MKPSRNKLSRRELLNAFTLLAVPGLLTSIPAVMAQDSDSPVSDLPLLIEFQRLIAANRILANENVVDAFGHVSVRDPRNPDRFIMSRSRSPALVEFDDLMEFDLSGNAIDARGRTPYGERMIHAAIYDARPEIHSVVHHHAYAVLPFTITDVPLKPVVHAASVIGAEIPVWDIRERYGDTDMLVRRIEQGRDLAATLADNTCLLMRGHGAVVVGESIERAVLTAVYLQVNADVLLQTRALGEPVPLNDEEIRLSSATQFSPLAIPRAWEYFCQRAGVDPV
ncbi:class II aldolase/adducin family protein [Gammaproteobacteria bacterium]|jgi:ribulose-5-phosphate 4-epimerase/fuculose-1-phosphate aldolase|nr:class II aldolase/adducin family protein [Gammaproteobacteria bacterium]